MSTTFPIHPNVSHVASLPAFTGFKLATWSSHPKDQALKLMGEFEVSEPLPKKGMAVIIQMPFQGFPLIRVTLCPAKSTYGKPLYAFEFFAPVSA